MWRLLVFSYQHSSKVLLAAVGLSVLAWFPAREFELDVGSESLVPESSEARAEYLRVREMFGSDLASAVYAEDEALFTPERLRRLKTLNDQLAELAFVERIESLFTLPDIRNVDDMLVTSPLLSEIPDELSELGQKQAHAADNLLLKKNVVSADGNATVLTIYLDPSALEEHDLVNIQEQIDQLLATHRESFDYLFQLGKPSVHSWLQQTIRKDALRILPAAGLILLLLLMFNLRSSVAGMLPIINSVITTLWTMGVMTWVGIPVNLLNYILPALILVIGATEDVHLLHEFRQRRQAGLSGLEAMRETSSCLILALSLTALTTILGFAATMISPLPILQDFGRAAVIGMTLRLFVTLFVLPAAIRITEKHLIKRTQGTLVSESLSKRISHFIMENVVHRAGQVTAVLLLISLSAVAIGSQIEISNDLRSFISPKTSLSEQMDRAEERIAGNKILYLTLYGSPGSFLQPDRLNQLSDITDYLRSMPELDTAISFSDVVMRINHQLKGGGDEVSNRVLPETESGVKQLLLFADSSQFRSFVQPDYSNANIVIRCSIHDSSLLNSVASRINQTLDSGMFGPQVHSLTGDALLVAGAVDSIVLTQAFSLAGIVGVLFLVVSGLFLSFRCGLLTVFANLISVTLIFGIMGLLGISLNVGTCMVAAITLGIAIDDTLHLLVRYNRELKKYKDEATAIDQALRSVINPIVSTSLALMGGFLMLSISSFQPVREFGLLSSGVIALALVTDLIVTPVFFARTRLITPQDIMGVPLRRRLLSESLLFKGFSTWQARKLILVSTIEDYPAGSTVIKEGEMGDRMYVILSGEMEASILYPAGRRVLARFGLGDIIGEIAIVGAVRRTADVTAISDVRLMALDFASLESLRRYSPYLASKLFLNLAAVLGRRLAELNKKIEQIAKEDPN